MKEVAQSVPLIHSVCLQGPGAPHTGRGPEGAKALEWRNQMGRQERRESRVPVMVAILDAPAVLEAAAKIDSGKRPGCKV